MAPFFDRSRAPHHVWTCPGRGGGRRRDAPRGHQDHVWTQWLQGTSMRSGGRRSAVEGGHLTPMYEAVRRSIVPSSAHALVPMILLKLSGSHHLWLFPTIVSPHWFYHFKHKLLCRVRTSAASMKIQCPTIIRHFLQVQGPRYVIQLCEPELSEGRYPVKEHKNVNARQSNITLFQFCDTSIRLIHGYGLPLSPLCPPSRPPTYISHDRKNPVLIPAFYHCAVGALSLCSGPISVVIQTTLVLGGGALSDGIFVLYCSSGGGDILRLYTFEVLHVLSG